MKPWGIPVLTGYSCEDSSHPEPPKPAEIPQDLSLWRRPKYLLKSLDISSVTTWVAPDLLKP